MIGNYLRKPHNVFASLQSSSISVDFIKALQAAGAVRTDVDPVVTAHLVEALSYGQLTMVEFKTPGQLPPLSDVIEAVADMMDRWLLPDDGGNSEAGKEAILQIVAVSRERLQFAQGPHARELTRSGVTKS